MTCQECELALAGEERSESVDRHLTECAACREFAVDLRENCEVFAAFGAEAFRVERTPAVSRPRRIQWQRAAAGMAIAAMLALALGLRTFLPRTPRIQNVPAPVTRVAVVEEPSPQIRPAVAAVRHRAPRPSPRRSQPKILQIKMLTDDPDVVMYWQVEN
jgi:hypothetical protein